MWRDSERPPSGRRLYARTLVRSTRNSSGSSGINRNSLANCAESLPRILLQQFEPMPCREQDTYYQFVIRCRSFQNRSEKFPVLENRRYYSCDGYRVTPACKRSPEVRRILNRLGTPLSAASAVCYRLFMTQGFCNGAGVFQNIGTRTTNYRFRHRPDAPK